MNLFRKFFGEMKEREGEVHQENIRIRFFGRRHLFPEDIQKTISEAEEMTKDNTAYNLNICFGYGGREEIVDASKKLAQDVKDGKVSPENISEDMLDTYMYLDDKPDIIIRTGGDHRTSNFLSWQSAYSEWFFVDKMWPEFEEEDFKAVLDDFKSRDRRFGK